MYFCSLVRDRERRQHQSTPINPTAMVADQISQMVRKTTSTASTGIRVFIVLHRYFFVIIFVWFLFGPWYVGGFAIRVFKRMWLFTRSSCFAPSASNFSWVDPHLSECGVYIVIIVSLSIYMSLEQFDSGLQRSSSKHWTCRVSSKPLRIQRPSDSCPSCCPRSLMLERCFVTIFGIAQVHLLYMPVPIIIYHSGGWYLNARILYEYKWWYTPWFRTLLVL
jgi:hypothetical protein